MTVLDEIVAHKRTEVAQRSASRPLAELRAAVSDAAACRGFAAALRNRIDAGQPGVIAEIKRASPSKGLIRPDFDPAALAQSYQAGGATCLSVLTDEAYFQGADAYLQAARDAVSLPVLRKDFVIDEYQLWEARALGADCVLLIVAILGEAQLLAYHDLATQLGLDVLVEVHDDVELRTAAALEPALLGINNRNLHTFETTLDTTEALAALAPAASAVISESGIHTRADVDRVLAADVRGFLIGEAFMRAEDPGTALAALFHSGVSTLPS